MPITRASANASRFRAADAGGFYESWFQRANHPTRPLAFWIRYTVFSPRGRPGDACGELWAVWFDGENDRISAVRRPIPIAHCAFSPARLDVRIGDATLTEAELHGRAESSAHTLQWSLQIRGDQPPLLLLPEAMYQRRFPKAKALVGCPNAEFNGTLVVDGQRIAIDRWRGSQNHNWGSRHTDRYLWGQVAGFDDATDAFLECCTAQVRLGPLWTPRLSFLVLRDRGEQIALNGLLQAGRASSSFDDFDWTIDTHRADLRIHVRFHAPPRAFVGLTYPNPPGGSKTCLNSKLASAELVIERAGQSPRVLRTAHRAAFEILTERQDHGVAVVA